MHQECKAQLPWYEYSPRTPKKARRPAKKKGKRYNRQFKMTFFCDKLKSEALGFFTDSFPEYKGQRITLDSRKALSVEPLVYEWLCAAGKL